MNEEERFIPFYEEYEGDFLESIEDIRKYLKNNNEDYKTEYKKLHNILNNNLNIQKLLYLSSEKWSKLYLKNGPLFQI